MNQILIGIGSLPFVLAQKNASGVAELAKGGWLRYGMVGSGDIIGTLTLTCGIGQHFEIEAKTGRGVQTPEQKARQITLAKRGALYVLAHNEREAIDGLMAARDRSWM